MSPVRGPSMMKTSMMPLSDIQCVSVCGISSSDLKQDRSFPRMFQRKQNTEFCIMIHYSTQRDILKKAIQFEPSNYLHVQCVGLCIKQPSTLASSSTSCLRATLYSQLPYSDIFMRVTNLCKFVKTGHLINLCDFQQLYYTLLAAELLISIHVSAALCQNTPTVLLQLYE